MDEETSAQTPTTESETVSTPGQGAEQTTSVSSDTGSEAQTNTGAETDAETMVPIPASKWRETQRAAREYEKLQSAIESQSVNNQPASRETTELDPQSAAAINVIADAVHSRLAPQLSYLEKRERDDAIVEVGNKPFSADLADEIGRNYNLAELRNLPPRDRMNRAYELAVGRNIDKLMGSISSKAEESGRESAYQKIAEKQSATPASGGASAPRDSESFLDRIGEMTPAEYEKHRADIWREIGLGSPNR